MKVVIDTNQMQSHPLRTDRLRNFLSSNPKNIAVITDYAAMEAYKGDTLSSIFKSMEVLSEFPDQVLILKNTIKVCGLHGRASGLQKRLIDKNQTRHFPTYVRHLRLAQRGHTSLKIQLLDHGRAASEHMNRLLAEIQDTGQAHKEIRSIYTKSELAAYRNGGTLPQSFFSKSLPEIFEIAKINFEKHPELKRLPKEKELINTFIFRSCLCYYLFTLDCVARGGTENSKPEKHRNDLIDSIFVTFATYFEGFMTCDARASRVYDEASIWISAIQRADAKNQAGG